MSKRINITLTDEEYENVVRCYKHLLLNAHLDTIPTLTGYVGNLVNVTVKRILNDEEKS